MTLLALALPTATLWAATFTIPAPQASMTPISNTGCIGAPTITGSPAICELFGDPAVSANNVQLVASQLPPNQFTMFVMGLSSVPAMTVNSGNGWICINPTGGAGVGRFQNQIRNSGPLGTVTLDTTAGDWDLAALRTSVTTYPATVGTTNIFSAWFR